MWVETIWATLAVKRLKLLQGKGRKDLKKGKIKIIERKRKELKGIKKRETEFNRKEKKIEDK